MNATNKTQNRKALNDAQKMTIRAALATGATIATLLGAQTMAFFEQQPTTTQTSSVTEQIAQPTATAVTNTTASTTTTNVTVSNIASSSVSSVSSAVSQPQPRSQSSR